MEQAKSRFGAFFNFFSLVFVCASVLVLVGCKPPPRPKVASHQPEVKVFDSPEAAEAVIRRVLASESEGIECYYFTKNTNTWDLCKDVTWKRTDEGIEFWGPDSGFWYATNENLRNLKIHGGGAVMTTDGGTKGLALDVRDGNNLPILLLQALWYLGGKADDATDPAHPAPTSPVPNAPATSPWPNLAEEVAGGKKSPKDAAVIVAVGSYAFLADIEGAVGNGEDWYRYFVKTQGIPAENVIALFDNDATDHAILGSVEDAARKAKPGGKLWFVFVGHGAPSEKGDDGLLVTVDAQQTVEGLESRSVRQSELLARLAKSAAQPFVVIDACYSGRESSGKLLVPGLQPSAVVKTKVPNTIVMMTAARNDQFAGALPGDARPAFSYLLLGAMRGWADDDGNGEVTTNEAVLYSGGTLRTLLRSRRSQTPQLISGGRDTVLSNGTERGPDLADLVLKLRATGTR